MGLNELARQVGGQVAKSDSVNQFRDALSDDFVPRNDSGVPEGDFASLGTSTFFWASSFIKDLVLGSGSNAVRIESVNEQLSLKNGLTEVQRIGVRPISNDGTDPGVYGLSITAQQDDFVTVASTWEATTFSATLTTIGRPVLVQLIHGDTPSTNVSQMSGLQILDVGTTGDGTYSIRCKRNGNIVGSPITMGMNQMPSGAAIVISPSGVQFLDTPTAGTHTYTLEHEGESSSGIQACRLMVMEL